ncbi:MAG: hypothetical protein R3B41_03805 [Candidatus Doudnabacteria bacterium]
MNDFLAKLAGFFRWLGQKLTQGGKWIVTGLILLAIIVTGVLLADSNSKDNNDKQDSSPEVAQIFEPSISSPLPADGSANGSTDASTEQTDTNTSSNSQEAQDDSSDDSGQVAGATSYVAPATGKNEFAPVKYYNDQIGFNTTLPTGTQVKVGQNNDVVEFYDQTGNFLFSISSQDNTDSLTTIATQLRLSQADQINTTQFKQQSAISFNLNGYQGLVFKKNNSSIYLTGQSKYFEAINL